MFSKRFGDRQRASGYGSTSAAPGVFPIAVAMPLLLVKSNAITATLFSGN